MIKKISEIVLNDNRRKVDAAKVKELAESIKQLGLINPITINSNNVLIAGNHRLEAFKLLGKDEIEVSVLELNNLLAELAEIDENLVRNELHWTDADKQIARRKIIYLELYPETKAGGDRKSDKIKTKILRFDTPSFSETTANLTNQSKRTIEQSVKRGEEITEEEAEVLKTIDAPKSYGDILIKQTTETRAKVIDALKVESKPVEIIIQEIKKEEKKILTEEKKEEQKKIIESITNIKLKDIETTIEKGWYKVGKQFLYFGSNTDKEFIDKLPKAKFAFADPPYNAGVDKWDFDFKWELDYLENYADVIAVTPGGWNACNFYKETNMNYIWEMFCWITNGMTHGKCGYANVIKTSIFGKVKPKISQDFWKINIDISKTEDTKHKGRKPYDFMIHLIDLFTNENDIVIDVFGGSGTTMLMCEQMNRISYNAEIDKQYCIDIIKRIGNYERI